MILIAEALWLLSDPSGYKNKIKSMASKETVEKTVRQLKTAQSKKLSSSSTQDSAPSASRKRQTKKTIQRQNNMFKRF